MIMENTWIVVLLLGLPLTQLTMINGPPQLKSISEWGTINFNFPTQQQLDNAIMQSQFIPGMSVPIDFDVHYGASRSRVFMTFPRFRNGVPVTLGTLSPFRAMDGSTVIEPYPNYSWHENPTQDCLNKMVSVFRIAIDSCDRLWVVDTGKLGLSTSPQICPPKILVFDLNTDQLIHRYVIPRDQYIDSSLFITPIIDVCDPFPGSCSNTKAYIADVTGFALIVYDSMTDSSWRVRNKLMFPSPEFGTHTISGESFELMDGIFGMAIDRNTKSLIFHALASENENSVPLSVLNNATAWRNDVNSFPNEFRVIGRKGTQSAASAIDSNGNLFFGLNNMNSLACWNTNMRSLSRSNIRILLRDDEKLQFTSGLKVIRNSSGEEELWILTNRFQKVMTGTLNSFGNEVNFRLMAVKISDLLGLMRCI